MFRSCSPHLSILRMRVVGLTHGRPFDRLRIALNFEKGPWRMLVFEDYIQEQIDDKNMDDTARKQYIINHLDDDSLFTKIKNDLISLQQNVIFPHVSTIKQQRFIESFGGVIINITCGSDLEKIWFVNSSFILYNLVSSSPKSHTSNKFTPPVFGDTRDMLLQGVS